MFWTKGKLWENFFNKIDINKIYDIFECGKYNDNEIPRHAHTMERLFGINIKNDNLKIIGI
jgi:hypothetical protein